jgi:hypothetical protein
MPLSICTACGTQYAESAQAPAHCVICEEERQYVPPRGQTWTSLEALRQSHSNTFREYETGIIGTGSTPSFAIGQRALLVRTENGNILWDCIASGSYRRLKKNGQYATASAEAKAIAQCPVPAAVVGARDSRN